MLHTKLFKYMKPCQITPLLIVNHTHFVDVLIALYTTMMKVMYTLYTLIAVRQFYSLFQKQMLQ
jgi:hypothetical protein